MSAFRMATGNGDVSGPASSVDSEVALFSGTDGKTVKRATGTGIVRVASGVYQTPVSDVGTVVQTLVGEYTAADTALFGNIPVDNTIPQITEGDQIISVAITPRFTNSKIIAWFSGIFSAFRSGGSSPSTFTIAAIFVDGVSNCLNAAATFSYDNSAVLEWSIMAQYTVSSGTARTFSVRTGYGGGENGTHNYYVNGYQLLGGGTKATLVVQEIRQ